MSFSPMNHWTEHNIRIHTFTCVLALQAAHLMRPEARNAANTTAFATCSIGSPASTKP
ncbi:hypothetical protein IV500_02940 [Paeniglutamicibacter antarcticus]|uniref:Uncharacterized protein n=1 Tax=Arthrobacter terrae TaxID=2935737 RepID=A0A931G387_9MICC|nr:hypothetical protein [Arthrobacter terrae]MBG0738386.1 hypothetical protein [Arthrobacter terrae]